MSRKWMLPFGTVLTSGAVALRRLRRRAAARQGGRDRSRRLFRVPFADIANVLDRSEAAVQQLASRARRVRGSPEPNQDLARQREVVDAFAASRNGDFEALLAVLDPEVELR